LKTERLYYDDPWLLQFEARVVALTRHGGRSAAVLDRTAFHPEGGGQPHDTGSLGGSRVIDVVSDEAGAVLHVLDGEAPLAVGQAVRGSVDAGRRRDHLQQHSGQHLLSAAFVRVAGAATRSFHLGARTSTIDLDRTPEELGDLSRVEEAANRVIAEDRPMTARVVDEDEARRLPLRKDVPVTGPVRIVSIEGFDLTPCGGTHARRSGEIGALAILGSERHRRGTRVEFVAGDRVRRALHRAAEEAGVLGALLSAPEGERVAALTRLLEERRGDARRLKDLASRAASLEAAALAAGATGGVVRLLLTDRGREEVEAMARAIAERGAVALVGFADGAAGRVVLAGPGRPPVGPLLATVAARFGGRGGGSATFAQGGGLPAASLADLLEALEREARAAGGDPAP
jgi:alanyl-tRNA synthetase